MLGHPPKVVWIGRGNCSTVEIEGILRSREADLLAFEQEEQGAFLAWLASPGGLLIDVNQEIEPTG